MRVSVRSVVLTLALVAAATLLVAADPPYVGTWKLNPAKSNFGETTVTYEQMAGGQMKLTADGQSYTFKTDGKDYPLTGSPNFDTLTLKQVDSHTVHSIQKKGGKVVGETTRTVSRDGKELTLASKGTTTDGVAYDNVMVYDKK